MKTIELAGIRYDNGRMPIVSLLRPFQEFAARETTGGILLLACTIAALFLANSPWAGSWAALWHTRFIVGTGSSSLDHDLRFWVNDGIMAAFFFVVGLEIKRELTAGELASPRQAALPVLAALGGVLVPALLYSALNARGPGAPGWGIPMATDIAFAMGVLALLGARVPVGLKVFLTALAIVDDIAAVVVIALFYTSGIGWGALGLAGVCILMLFAANRLGVRHSLPYGLGGIVLWMAVLASGVHATIAGVLLAFTIPCRATLEQRKFLHDGRAALDAFERTAETERGAAGTADRQIAIQALEEVSEKMQSPLHRMERKLHPWVAFAIMPLFALANAGVPLSGDAVTHAGNFITLGVMLGLVLGKPIGITLASWLAVRLGWASLPQGVSWKQIHGAGWVAGIGFTMSFFMTGLSFADDASLTAAKLGILTASLSAGIVGSLILARTANAGGDLP